MSIRPPDLGPAGRSELDEPTAAPGLAPADRRALAGEPTWPVAPPPAEQPTAGGVRQPLGTEEGSHPLPSEDDDEHEIGDPNRVDDRREDTDGGGFSKD